MRPHPLRQGPNPPRGMDRRTIRLLLRRDESPYGIHRSLQPQERDRHKGAALQGRRHSRVSALQTGGAGHPGEGVAEAEVLRGHASAFSLLGHAGGG